MSRAPAVLVRGRSCLSSQTGRDHSATGRLTGNHAFHICGQFDFPGQGDSGGIEATG